MLSSSRRYLQIGLLLLLVTSAPAQITYEGRVGFFTGSYLTVFNPANRSISGLTYLAPDGTVVGYSNLYIQSVGVDGATPAVWVAPAGGAAIRLGLLDFEHTSSNGGKFSYLRLQTSTGWYAGDAMRFSGSGTLGQDVWVATAAGVTTQIGLLDAEHIYEQVDSYTNIRYSGVGLITLSGYVGGYSRSQLTDNTLGGQSAWVATGNTGSTARVGLYDAAHTSSSGYRYSRIDFLNEAGQGAGVSDLYNSSASLLGVSAWTSAADGTTLQIGLTDATHTGTEGGQRSYLIGLNSTGHTAGYSNRYQGDSVVAYSSWVANSAGVTSRTGFLDAEHTAGDGLQSSMVTGMVSSGLSYGYSTRYNGGASDEPIGQSAWVASAAGSTTLVGLTGAAYESSSGFKNSAIVGLTAAGWVAGNSDKYDSVNSQAAWAGNYAGTIHRVGLFDAVHTAEDGMQSSSAQGLTLGGIAYGTSAQGVGGTSVWIASAATGATARIGLYDGAHVTVDDRSINSIQRTTASGWFAGYAYRVGSTGSFNGGTSSWVADAAGTTHQVGLYGGYFVDTHGEDGAPGSQKSLLSGLNESGYAWGYSDRYGVGGVHNNQTAWLFDPTSSTTIAFDISVRSNGFSFSQLAGVTENGLAYGTYELFSSDISQGDRAFIWSVDLGTQTLDDAIAGGVAQYGWSHLTSILAGNAAGDLVGLGRPSDSPDGSAGVFMVSANLAAVPEPSAYAALAGLGALVVAAWRRKRRRPDYSSTLIPAP
ncbi:MAG: PEP-CTERM sorting domain-containing protein [Lacunisphaera sp.]|nr:PEP-CTERM sorting domain-containing protein [Lacunisphaera sp.]